MKGLGKRSLIGRNNCQSWILKPSSSIVLMSIWATKCVERSLIEEKDCSLDILYPSSMATETNDEGKKSGQDLRLRRSSPTLVPSISDSESSISDYEDQSSTQKTDSIRTHPTTQANNGSNNITLHKIVTSTAFQKRLSRQSSLSWGHKPSPLIGASCFLFLLPIPLLLRACCPVSAFLLGCVTASSYLSDHVFTGLESWTHTLDRVLAPMAFATCLYSTYCNHGVVWAVLSLAALKCHVRANYYAKNGMYDQFVIWHSLWHAVGVGLILVCFTYNGNVGKCWEGSGWEDIFRERFMN